MSQVIVTNDALKNRRAQTAQQEAKISREEGFQRWRRNDITKPDAALKIITLVLAPVMAVWAFIALLMTAAVWLVRLMIKGLGQLLGGTKNLTTGE